MKPNRALLAKSTTSQTLSMLDMSEFSLLPEEVRKLYNLIEADNEAVLIDFLY
jgi:hypothetical protein